MPLAVGRPKTYDTVGDALEFAFHDMSGLLNIKSTPQQVAENELTQAVNVYGSADGSVTVRRGMALYGHAFGTAGQKPQGIKRFFQVIAHGVPQNPPIVFTVAAMGGTLYNVETGAQIGPTESLGSTPSPWHVVRVSDPDNGTLGIPATPLLSATGTTGLSPGTYEVGVTYINAFGESVLSPLNKITLGSTADILVTSPAPAGAASNVATGYNVYVAAVSTPQLQPQRVVSNAIGTNSTIAAISLTGAYPPTADTTGAMTDSLVICTGSGGPYLFDGTSVFVPPQWSSSVANAQWCEVVNGVLWFGGLPAQPNLVWGSQVGHPQIMPYYNTFAMSTTVTGLTKVGAQGVAGLVVGMNEGRCVIYGTGPSNFYVQDVPNDNDGTVSGRSMLSVLGFSFSIGRAAIYRFDGWNLVPISGKVEPWILNDPLYQQYAMNGPRSESFSFFYNNRIHFCYDSSSVGYANTILCYDLLLNGWTVLAPGKPFVDACLLDAPGDPAPAQCLVLDQAIGQAYLWDAYNGTNVAGTGIDDAGVPINAVAATKFFKIGQSGTPKRIQRVYPEIFTQQFTGSVELITDYGAAVVQSLTNINFNILTNALIWDVGMWDVSIWGGSTQSYASPRVDFPSTEFEAVSFALVSNPADPPFTWQGISGQWTQGARV